MHECATNDKRQLSQNVTALDIVKRLMENGHHPPAVYFLLVVPGAIMVEPTETECKPDLDGFLEAMQSIAREVEQNSKPLASAPNLTKVGRLDETAAARSPCLTG